MKRFAITFIVVEVVSAGIAWVSGYDFNYRSPDVGFNVFLAILAGIVSAIFSLAAG